MVIDRQRGGIENSVVLVRLVCVCVCVGGWCRPSPAMQCWAVSSNHVPAVGERGLGQRLTTAKESSRSDGEKERRECVREKSELESGSVQWYPALQDSASVLSLQLSLYISPLFARIPHHCSDPSSLLFSALFCYNHCFSVVSTDRFLLLLLHLYFFLTLSIPFLNL